jgi:hypothetical protein
VPSFVRPGTSGWLLAAFTEFRDLRKDGIPDHLRVFRSDSVDGLAERIVSCHEEVTQLSKSFGIIPAADCRVVLQYTIYGAGIAEAHVAGYGQAQEFSGDSFQVALPGGVLGVDHDPS